MSKQIISMIVFTTVLIFSGLTQVETAELSDSPDLQTIMRLIYLDIQTINKGIYTENYALIEQGATVINEHPPLSEETRIFIKKL